MSLSCRSDKLGIEQAPGRSHGAFLSVGGRKAHAVQPGEVCRERAAKRGLAAVAHAVRSAGFLDDGRQRRIVQVADPRKEVVLDLEVEPAEVPPEQRIRARK